MISILESISTAFISILQFIVNTIHSLIIVITEIPAYVSFVTQLTVAVPVFAQIYLVAGVTVTVVMCLFLNRGN